MSTAEVIIDKNQVSVKMGESSTFMVTDSEVALQLAELLNSVAIEAYRLTGSHRVKMLFGDIKVVDRR